MLLLVDAVMLILKGGGVVLGDAGGLGGGNAGDRELAVEHLVIWPCCHGGWMKGCTRTGVRLLCTHIDLAGYGPA